MKPKYLITGGTGFTGRHLQEELKRRGESFVVFAQKEFDLTRGDHADKAFAKHQDATVILHMASYQAAGEFPGKHTAGQFFINNLIHTNVLEAWRKHLPHAKLVAFGCSCAYPSNALVLKEEVLFDGPIHGSVYAYGFTKRLLATGVLAYNDQHKLNGSFIMPATLYGEYDDYDQPTAHVGGALVDKFVQAAREHRPEVEIWGDGTAIREFLDVKEFVRVLLDLVPKLDRDTVNVGPGYGKTIRELAETIAQAAGFKGRLNFNASRYVGIKEKFMNAEKLRSKYGLSVNGDLGPGIRRTVEWYAANYEAWHGRPKFGPATG